MTHAGRSAGAFIHGFRAGQVPAEALHMARRCFVDTIAVWAAGSPSEASRIARDHAAKRYPGGLPMPFDGRPVNSPGIAFAGAATIDSLDAHDGHQLCKGHASVALVPALLAELGETDCSLDELMCHLVVGQEIAIRAGLSLHATVPDYHASGAWNALGCAAIASRLRRLTREQTRQALGIAEYYGPRSQMMRGVAHPTMVKDSSAWGALTGIAATDLAEDGFTGAPALTVEAPEVADIWSDLGNRWRILESNFKAYPVCRWAHPAVEAVLSLVRSEGLLPDQIDQITVFTFQEATTLDMRRPMTSDEAQYSLPLAVALALRFDTILPEHLWPGRFDDEDIWRLVDLVRMEESDTCNAAFPVERYARVTLTVSSGDRFRSEITAAPGNHDAPLSDRDLIEKLERYARDIFDASTMGVIAGVLAEPSRAIMASDLVRVLRAVRAE